MSAPTIIIADDDEGQALLVRENLREAGVINDIIHFKDGQAVLNFLFGSDENSPASGPYVLLLDIRMPKIDGIAVLKRIKEDNRLRRMLVIVLTTTNDPREVERCHQLGCNIYVQKPIRYDLFAAAVQRLGSILMFALVPALPQSNPLQDAH